MPKFALFVRGSPEAESGAPPSTSMLEEMTAYNKSLADAGLLVTLEGLLASTKGARVTFSSSGNPNDTTVTPGPFEPGSIVSGFWVIKAKDLDEAVAWARKVPFKTDDSVVEVRQVAGGDDFGDQMTDEVRAKVEDLRTKLDGAK